MMCPQCGNENPPKLKFCVKCGVNLNNPQEINYEQVDMGNYHSEDDNKSGGFTLGSGTFKISDSAPVSSSSDLYTADELNDDDEEFDFSSFDEPFIPKLDTGRVTLPQQPAAQQRPANPQADAVNPNQAGMNVNNNMYGSPQPNAFGAPMSQMNAMPQMGAMPVPPVQPQMQAMQGQPAPGGMPVYGQPQPIMYAQPQIIGYDPSGMPIYGQPQPMMYAQPQIIGYDQSGMPIYSQPQPMMYAQPQIIGYDQSGMPIYGQPQPMMYAQPQIIGYDPSGMPVYSQPQPVYGDMNEPRPNPQNPQFAGMPVQPNMHGMPNMQPSGGIPGIPVPPVQPPPQFDKQSAPPEKKPERRVEVSDDFWAFFDGGKKTEHAEPADDFFGKHDMGSVSAEGLDTSRLKRFERKKNDYMGDTPLVDSSKLTANTSPNFNKLYMRQTDSVNADELQAKSQTRTDDIMGVTQNVDADRLNSYVHMKSRISMENTAQADAGQLEAYVHEHKEAVMAQADHAVEALPKKKTTYVDEIDAIELPDHMQAKKTVKESTPEIPGLPEI